MTPVEICNQALGRIGQSAPIQSLGVTDRSEAGLICGRLFDPARRALLTEFHWPFAMRFEALAHLPESVQGYAYSYAYPGEALHVHAVLPQGESPWRKPYRRTPFQRIGQQIVCDQPHAFAHFVADADAEDGGPLFEDALCWRMASELAMAMKVDPRLAQFAREQYFLVVTKALAATSNEGQDEGPLDAETIQVRQ